MGIAAGILLVLISIAHFIYGEKKQIPPLKKLTDDSIMIGSLRVMIFQGGLLLLAVGIFQILVSVSTIELTGVARYIPVGIVLINFSTALFISVFAHICYSFTSHELGRIISINHTRRRNSFTTTQSSMYLCNCQYPTRQRISGSAAAPCHSSTRSATSRNGACL